MSVVFDNTRRLANSLYALLALAATPATAETLSRYSDFQAMSLADVSTLQMKLTVVDGKRNAPIATLLVGAPGTTLNAGLFVPYRRSGMTYSYEDVGQHKFTLSTQELKAIIDSVATLPGVADGDVDTDGTLSFALLNTVGGTKVFESIVNQSNGQALFGKLLEALHSNAQAVKTLRAFGCETAMLPASAPASVQSQVQVSPSGLRANGRSPREFVGKVSVTNSSGSALAAPVILVFQINGDANLVGEDGFTCNISPYGHPYVVLAPSGMAPSATIVRTVRFDNPSQNKLNVIYRVFAGSGTP